VLAGRGSTRKISENPSKCEEKGIREDGSEVELAAGYPSRGWCYASTTKATTKAAIDTTEAGNPHNLVRLEMRDKDNQPVPGYNNPDTWLKIPQPGVVQ
jgi:hypothetical protein